MRSPDHPILEQIDSARFPEASSELEKLHCDVASGSIPVSDALAILRAARYRALAQRSQLLKSLSITEASRLFGRDTPATVASWVMEA